METDGEPLAVKAGEAADDDGGEAQEDFAEIDVKSHHGVVESELECISEQIARQEDKRRRVGPEDCNIGEEEEPCRQESVVVPEDGGDEAVGAARSLDVQTHPVVVVCQDADGRRAYQHPQKRADGTRVGQEGGAGEDKCAPADCVTEG